jgi:predicted metalloprotease
VTRLQQQAGSKAEANALQVKVELQADCLSGVWVNREEKKRPGFLEAGDIDAALRTATAIGDDTLQRQATGGWCRTPSPTAPPRSASNGS